MSARQPRGIEGVGRAALRAGLRGGQGRPPYNHWRWAAAGWLVFVAVIVFCADRRLMKPLFAFITANPGLDKAGHFVLIGGLAFLLNLALGLREFRGLGRGWLLGSAVVAVLCVLEEFSQLWFPARRFDLLDLVADGLGILFFGWLARRVFRRPAQV